MTHEPNLDYAMLAAVAEARRAYKGSVVPRSYKGVCAAEQIELQALAGVEEAILPSPYDQGQPMRDSAYQNYDDAARAEGASSVVTFSCGKVETDSLGNVRLTLNLAFGPYPTVWSRKEAGEIADALNQLLRRTSPPRPEE